VNAADIVGKDNWKIGALRCTVVPSCARHRADEDDDVGHPSVSRDRRRMLSKRSRCECYQAVKTQSSARCVVSEHLRRAFLVSSRRFVSGQVAHATAGAPKILSQPASATISGCAGLDQDSFSDQFSKSMTRAHPLETARASCAIASLFCEVEARDADAGANCQNIRRRFSAPRLPVRP
jgi:hypothetical protein